VTIGSGVLSAKGTFGAVIDLSSFPDGTITVRVTLTGGGAPSTTLTTTMGKNSVAPPAPIVAAPAYANIANDLSYTLTITGQVGSIANVVMTDGGLPLPNVANGMDVIGSTGTLSLAVDSSNLKDGSVSISVTLTNGAGDSAAWAGTITKDTLAPAVGLAAPTYINIANVKTYQPLVTTEAGATAGYVMTDGKSTQSGAKPVTSSGQWNLPIIASSFKDGPITLTVTVTDPAGNPTVVTANLVKDTVAPAGSFTIGGTVINGTTATNNSMLPLSLAFTATSGIGTVAFSTNGGSTYGAAQPFATTASVPLTGSDGVYTIAVQVTSNAGNIAIFTKQVRLDRSGPAIAYSVTSPTNGGSYDIGQAVTLTYSGSDVDNVASVSALLDGTTSITTGVALNTETLSPGTHTIVITAKDGVGNVSTTAVTFTVHATVAGLTKAVNDGVAASKITSGATSSQLISYLSSAQSALNAGNHTSAKSYLASFVSLVQAQSGVSISVAYAALLVSWAQDLIGRL
jgi:hypothetical protein